MLGKGSSCHMGADIKLINVICVSLFFLFQLIEIFFFFVSLFYGF